MYQTPGGQRWLLRYKAARFVRAIGYLNTPSTVWRLYA